MHWMTAAELASGYRKKAFSPVEVTQHLLSRIDALNPKYHAFIEVDHEGALAAARQAEETCSRPLLAGDPRTGLNRVVHQHRDRHRSHAAGHRRDP